MSAAPGGHELERTRDAVVEAGRIAMRHFRREHRRWEKGPGQIVTEADIAIDRYLHAALRREHPSDGWLSEETLDDSRRLGRHRVWVVDPIDGTRSFAEGLPEFTISVALLMDDRPALGFVYNPATSEMFEARRGGGAFLNGKRVHAATPPSLEGASIVCSKGENRRRHFEELLPHARLTTIGSLAYKLALVAAGRFDAYLSWRRSQDWDIAAAALLLAEAGAVLSDGDGNPIALNRPHPVHDGLIAAAPELHAAIGSATAEARRHSRR
ncbi:3'(2'),5'-bisphosphate nucleotidase CysQ [Geminicoccaceae bacterium 1502E]|nr:3'(2'),5'-bisphosphate nucleotidase CysQ [Geminicoccaceae bacterium 1502E]